MHRDSENSLISLRKETLNMAQAFTGENARIKNMSPLRQWLITQLDQLLCPGGVKGPTIRISTSPRLFEALTGLTQKKYDEAAPSMTCCTSFVPLIFREARKAGKLPAVPPGKPAATDADVTKYMPTFRMGDAGGNGPSSELRKAGCVYTWKSDPNGGPEPGDVYYLKDEKGGDKHIGYVRQYLGDGKYETYDGGLSHVNDGITFSESHSLDEDRLWWLDIEAAMSLLGTWTLQPQAKPSWTGIKG